MLAKTYDLDCDLVYQRQWRRMPVSVTSIQDYLVRHSVCTEVFQHVLCILLCSPSLSVLGSCNMTFLPSLPMKQYGMLAMTESNDLESLAWNRHLSGDFCNILILFHLFPSSKVTGIVLNSSLPLCPVRYVIQLYPHTFHISITRVFPRCFLSSISVSFPVPVHLSFSLARLHLPSSYESIFCLVYSLRYSRRTCIFRHLFVLGILSINICHHIVYCLMSENAGRVKRPMV